MTQSPLAFFQSFSPASPSPPSPKPKLREICEKAQARGVDAILYTTDLNPARDELGPGKLVELARNDLRGYICLDACSSI